MTNRIAISIILILSVLNVTAQANTEYIKTYCKVWGVCKYYSNSKNMDWDQVFFDQYDDLFAAGNDEELNLVLSQLIAQTKLRKKSGFENKTDFSILDFQKLKQNGEYILKTDFDWIFNSPHIRSENRHLLVELLSEFTGRKPKTTSFGAKIIKHDKELVYDAFSNQIAMLALLRFYNVIEYYYPYKHLLDTDWDSVLSLMIPEFVKCRNIQQYKNALNRFASFLQDSHVDIDFQKLNDLTTPVVSNLRQQYPIKFGYIDGELFVSNILNDRIAAHYQLEPGDKISRVNREDIPTILRKTEKYYAVSRKEDGYYALLNYLREVDSLEITVRNRDIEVKKVEMTRAQYMKLHRYGQLETTLERNNIKPDESIGYVYLPTSKYSKIDNIFRKFKHKETIILDCRGYGTLAALKLPKLLSKKKKDVASAYLSLKKHPGVFEKQKDETYYISNSIDLIGKFLFGYKKKVFPTFNTPYQGNVVVLIDDHAISFGETVIMILKVYAPNAVCIGRPTAGANGNVSTLTLPLGGALDYTAVDFKFADGTRVQRRGIVPEIVVPRTIEAEIAGKDEILNAALKYIESGKGD